MKYKPTYAAEIYMVPREKRDVYKVHIHFGFSNYDDSVEVLEELEKQNFAWLRIKHGFYFGKCNSVDIKIVNFKYNAPIAQKLLPQFLIDINYKTYFKYHSGCCYYGESMRGLIK